eukprot:g7496.t1
MSESKAAKLAMYLMSSPPGFNKACRNINAAKCVDGVFRDLVEEVIHNESNVHHGNIEDYARNLSVTGMQFRDVDAKNILEGLHFV